MVPKRLPLHCICFLWFLGPICLVLVIAMFLRRFLLLTPSYLARNDCPFGSHTHCGVVRLLNKLFCLGISACLLPPSIFLRLVAQMSLAVAQLKIRVWLPLEKKPILCSFSTLSANISNPSLHGLFFHSKKLLSCCEMLYVL